MLLVKFYRYAAYIAVILIHFCILLILSKFIITQRDRQTNVQEKYSIIDLIICRFKQSGIVKYKVHITNPDIL